MTPDLPTNTDGRVARRERTRRAIVVAHTELLQEGDLRPTADRIAARAGVSKRALWTNFKDMNALLAAVAEEVFQRMRAEHRTVDPAAPTADRITAYCAERARLLEILTPFARASVTRSTGSGVLRDYEVRHVRGFAREIETLFELELAGAGEQRRREVVHALTVATTWASWSMAREHLGLSVDDATAVLRRTFTDVLGAAAA